MSYLIFARKFRPQVFEDVVGQEPITRTLQNAIRQERIPQSFLFSGPRGVGKTSVARILAKALNCLKISKGQMDPDCESCREIAEGRSMDVLEIDGASNRGIEEIRNLRETVKFKPTSGKYKIYIIDEVHMLTTEAFNALLKTLEEPPPHVKFIFATTEPHKVPLTILSRCQRFNFRRIPVPEMVKKLEEIASKEKIKFDSNALFLIARASEGALRDAEGLLDQLATFSQGKIKEEDVLAMLGMAAESIYFDMLDALKEKDVTRAFAMVRQLHEEGVDMAQFGKGLFDLFRHLFLFASIPNAREFMEWSENAAGEFERRRQFFSRGELLLAMSVLQNLQANLRRNLAPPKLMIETALLKLVHLDGLRSLNQASAEPPAAPSGRGPAVAPAPPQAAPAKTGNASSGTSKKSPKAAAGSGDFSISEAESLWPRVIDYVKGKRMSTGIFLSESEPVEVQDETVTLGLPSELRFHKETLEKDASRKLIEEAFEVVGGRKLRIQFVITSEETVQAAASASEESGGEIPAAAEETKLGDILSDAMEIFQGARIIQKE